MSTNQKYAEREMTMNYYIFPALVCVERMLKTGELSGERFKEILEENLVEHQHGGEYELPEDWFEKIDHVVNKSGWKIFERPKIMEEERAAALQRKEAEAQARAEALKAAQAKKLEKAANKLKNDKESPPAGSPARVQDAEPLAGAVQAQGTAQPPGATRPRESPGDVPRKRVIIVRRKPKQD